jgi:uncharacterized membrane protein YcjF (UPF0283 family)
MNGHRAAHHRRAQAPEQGLMESNQHTVTIWQSGRLAPHLAPPRFEFGREQWLGAALLVLAALVLALFVAVLERDVDRSEMQHVTQRSRAVAEARCESDQPAGLRGRCIALFNGDVVAAQAVPETAPVNRAYDSDIEQENAARATTVSLLAAR